MKKKNAKKVLITAAIFYAVFNMNGCGAYGSPEVEYTEPVPEQTAISSEEGDTSSDSGISETQTDDDALTDLELDEMQAVDDAISELLNSDDYKSLSSEEERREAVIALITELAENGTEEFPYPLIIKSSVNTEGDIISFSYKCGVSGGVMTEPFDSMMN